VKIKIIDVEVDNRTSTPIKMTCISSVAMFEDPKKNSAIDRKIFKLYITEHTLINIFYIFKHTLNTCNKKLYGKFYE
jgi:hypothetical protein